MLYQGRAIAQAVSRWLPTAAARVWSCEICGGQSGAGARFLRVLRFPLPTFIPLIAPQSPSSIIWRLYNRPEVTAIPRDLVPPHKIIKNVVPTAPLHRKCIPACYSSVCLIQFYCNIKLIHLDTTWLLLGSHTSQFTKNGTLRIYMGVIKKVTL
jgi:hypothetical protein